MDSVKEMLRGFQTVGKAHIKSFDIFTDENGRKVQFEKEPTLPTRNDSASAGYDFYVTKDVQLLPKHSETIWTDVKAYMQPNEVLKTYIRSSLAIKHGLVLTNGTGIIDSSYYGNESNDGNIGISITNTSGKTYVIKAGERIAQGIFVEYLTTDDDNVVGERTGGIGSSGK